jgi:hypothetical protein
VLNGARQRRRQRNFERSLFNNLVQNDQQRESNVPISQGQDRHPTAINNHP